MVSAGQSGGVHGQSGTIGSDIAVSGAAVIREPLICERKRARRAGIHTHSCAGKNRIRWCQSWRDRWGKQDFNLEIVHRCGGIVNGIPTPVISETSPEVRLAVLKTWPFLAYSTVG